MLGFVASSCFLSERKGNWPKFCQKIDGAVFRRLVAAKLRNTWKRESILSKERSKLRKSPVNLVGGRVANSSYKFQFRASLSLYYRSPDDAAGTERTHRCYMEIEIIMERPSSFVIFCLITFSAAPLARANKTVISSRSNCARLMSSVG